MALFPLSGVLRGFPPATYEKYVSAQTLVRPCSEKKLLICELETNVRAHPFERHLWMGTSLVCLEDDQEVQSGNGKPSKYLRSASATSCRVARRTRVSLKAAAPGSLLTNQAR